MGDYKIKDDYATNYSTRLHLSLEDEEQQVNRQMPTYRYPQQNEERGILMEEKPIVRNIREKISHIREATTKHAEGDLSDWEVVEVKDKTSPELIDRSKPIELHNSRGTKMLNDGQNVLEFDIGGSGFQGFNQKQKLVKGKTKKFKKKYVETVWQQTYGEKLKVGGKVREFVRMKSKKSVDEKYEKRRITMAGPLRLLGILNAGEYKIEKLRAYMLECGQSYIKDRLPGCEALAESCKQMKETGYSQEEINAYCEEWKKIQGYQPITIVLKGHSRGGVAMSHGAMMIQYWINEKLPMLRDLIKFETIQYDPVPGPHMEKEKTEISLTGANKEERERLAKKKMAPLNSKSETTVIYSLHTQHNSAFTPQLVRGVKRIILSPLNHDVGLPDVDVTQEKMRRAGYTYSKKDASGEVKTDFYRNSGINELEEGVFVADEDGVLTKLRTPEEAQRFFTSVYLTKDPKNKDLYNKQLDRHLAVVKAVKAWFGCHRAPA